MTPLPPLMADIQACDAIASCAAPRPLRSRLGLVFVIAASALMVRDLVVAAHDSEGDRGQAGPA